MKKRLAAMTSQLHHGRTRTVTEFHWTGGAAATAPAGDTAMPLNFNTDGTSCFDPVKPFCIACRSASLSGVVVTIAKVVSRPNGGEASNLKFAPGTGTWSVWPGRMID